MTNVDIAISVLSIAAIALGFFASTPPQEEAWHRALDGSRCHDDTTTTNREEVS